MRRKKRILIVLIVLLLCIAWLSMDILRDKAGIKNGEIVEILVEEGSALGTIADQLEDVGIIKYKTFFVSYVKDKGIDTKIKAGHHIMSKNMGYKSAAEELIKNGQAKDLIKLTIPEGFEIYKTAERVEEVFGIPKDEFLRAAEEGAFEHEFLKNIPHRDNRLEGYLFPDTYIFGPDTTAENIIDMLLGTFDKVWKDEYEMRAAQIGMTMDDVIKLASVIEREAANEGEMPRVSSVFHNRIDIGMPLQSCATVQYILKERKEVLSIADTKIDSPYNTYMYAGLPLGPIASPGEAAIKAALYPEETPYYYFKVKEDGVSVFSQTLAEHNSR